MKTSEFLKSKRTWTIIGMSAFELLQHILGNR